MRYFKYFLILAFLIFLSTFAFASETESEVVGKGFLSKTHTYVILDTTFNGEFFYVLYYISGRWGNSKKIQQSAPTVLCLRKDDEGFFNGWYFHKLKIQAKSIIATEKYLICLDEIGGEVEIYRISESGTLALDDAGPILNSKYKTTVQENTVLISEK